MKQKTYSSNVTFNEAEPSAEFDFNPEGFPEEGCFRENEAARNDMRSGLSSYLSAIGNIPVLTADEEKALFARKEAGDTKAESKLIESNLRLVVFVAKYYLKTGLPLDELIQSGTVGLITAIEHFDASKGNKLSTYAVSWIKREVLNSINQQKIIRIPENVRENMSRMRKLRSTLMLASGYEPSVSEMAEAMSVSETKIIELMDIEREPVSLSSPVGEEEDSCLEDFVEDEISLTPEESAERTEMRSELMQLLKELTEKEKLVILYRYGLIDGCSRTLEEIAAIPELNTTSEIILQMEAGALKKMRYQLECGQPITEEDEEKFCRTNQPDSLATLFIYDILEAGTSRFRSFTYEEINDRLIAEHGVSIDRRTIGCHIDRLMEFYPEICRKENGQTYYDRSSRRTAA